MRVRRWFLDMACTVLFLVSPLVAQNLVDTRLPEFVMLGMDETQLATIQPAIKPVVRPQLGPRGAHGRWMTTNVLLFGVPFDTTFYTKYRRVTRIEKLWSTAKSGCDGGLPIERMLEDLRAQFGDGQASNASTDNESVRQSAVWFVDEAQMSLHTEVSPTRCSMRIVFQPRVVKDGAEL